MANKNTNIAIKKLCSIDIWDTSDNIPMVDNIIMIIQILKYSTIAIKLCLLINTL